MSSAFVIAVDGPAASGKGTLARQLAKHFDIPYLDTGKLYRATALSVLQDGNDPKDVDAAVEAAKSITPDLLSQPELNTEIVGEAASVVSAIPEVREALLEYQQDFAANPNGAVLDGRDIGTVICPDAKIKLFVTADIETRAKRRFEELSQNDPDLTLNSVMEDLQHRDERDQNRSIAPLLKAKTAIHIDTSNLNIEDVFNHSLALITPHLSIN